MVTNLCLVSCALLLAQSPGASGTLPPASRASAPARSSEWTLAPRLSRAQELVYHGTFEERSLGNGVQFQREYRLESRIFVLDARSAPSGSLDVAVFTTLRERNASNASCSARLERAVLEAQGRLVPDKGASLKAPLEGPPTIEHGAFVEAPRGPVPVGHYWSVLEAGRPPRMWTVAGPEMVNGTTCVKLVGVQKSDDWDKPRADHTAWRRTDTVWMLPRLGVASRVERVIERRAPARRDPTHRSTLRYELESSLQYPAQLVEDRRHEILQGRHFLDTAAPLSAHPSRHEAALTHLLARINYHLEHQPATPYRPAVLEVKQRVEAARRGEIPPTLPEDGEESTPPAAAVVGQKAPDFLTPDLLHPDKSARLQSWKGRPILMMFYSPKSQNAEELLRFAAATARRWPETAVLALAVTDDTALAAAQHKKLGLSLPLLQGSGLRISYKVESTPTLVVVDRTGVVRASVVGWGLETAREVSAELQQMAAQITPRP